MPLEGGAPPPLVGAAVVPDETEVWATGTTAGAVPPGALEICELTLGAAEPGVPGAAVVEHTQLEAVTVDTTVETDTETETDPPGPAAPPPIPPVALAPGAGGMPTTGTLPLLMQESAFR